MKNLKKIALLILLVVALVTAIAVSTFAEGEYTGTVAELTPLVNSVSSASDATARDNAIIAVGNYLEATPVDPSEAGYTDLMSTLGEATLAHATELLSAVAADTVTSTANNQIAINKVRRIVELGFIDESVNGYNAFIADYEARLALQEEAKEANRQKMLAKSTLTDYSLQTFINSDGNSNPFPTIGNLGSNLVSTSGGYITVHYGAQDTQNTFLQYNYPSDTQGSLSRTGVVVDFDFAVLGIMPPGGFHVEGGGHAGEGTPTSSISETLNGKPKIYPSYLRILDNGNICTGDGDGRKVLIQNGIVTGEWLHFTLIYNADDFTFSIYLEYEHLATFSAKVSGLTYNLSALRFAGSTKAKSDWSCDNVQVYQGTALREIGMFDRMSKPELFVYYANYFMDDTITDTAGRFTSQKYVNANIATYTDDAGNFKPFPNDHDLPEAEYQALLTKVETAVNALKSFDQSAFMVEVGKANRDTYISYVDQLANTKRELTTANVTAREALIVKIQDFLISIEGVIDENEDYEAAVERYTVLYAQRYVDENILDFIHQMDRYNMVSTLVALEKYYKKAESYLNDESYPIDTTLAGQPGFEAFAAAYNTYLGAADRIDLMKRNDNSKKIISCLEIVEHYDPDLWEEKYDEINAYVVMIRSVIQSGYYNPDYEGVDVAIERFAPIDDHFYLLLQEVHIAELTARLEYVYNNDAYIEKMGTLSYIGRYLENNDIDYSNEDIQTIVANYNTALEELSFREVDYETVLKQNANYFVSLVEKMRISDGFNEKKELYDLATGYYFALDATVEGALDAIAIYDEHTLWFENVDAASKLFLASVAVLESATTPDEKYAALVDCYVYSLDAEITYDGVASALEIFNREYEAYNASANAVNEAVAGVGVTVGSVRANCGVKSIIAVIIKKIFE